MKKHNFKNLAIWQRAMDLSDAVFLFCMKLPPTERFNLIDQINRSSCSIPSNIAEGSGKRTHKHFGEFLTTSLSSSYEIETQLLICQRRKYGNIELLNKILIEVVEIQKMIFSFRENLIGGKYD
jgi:four helix bundle protein